MIVRIAAAVAFAAIVALHAPAEAQSKTKAGAALLITGGILMAGAFDYKTDICPSGYSTHTYQDLPTQCVYVSYSPPYNSDVRDATTKATLKRRGLLWGGLGAAVGGVVLLLLPGNTGQAVSKAVNIKIDPERVQVGKTFGW